MAAPEIPPITFHRNPNPASPQVRQQRLQHPELGVTDTDHMATATYADGAWQTASIGPFTPFTLHPGAKCFQYGQTLFEGMQAFKHPTTTTTTTTTTAAGDGQDKIVLFRPDQNASRLNRSADRVAMPPLPEPLFLDLVKSLIWVERSWFPPHDQGGRLYIRPFMFATGQNVRFGVATEYTFCVLVSPARDFFRRDVLSVYVEPSMRRAGKGGTGAAKCGGNYAAALRAHKVAGEKGCDQAMFLGEGGKVQELEVTNVFFVMEGGRGGGGSDENGKTTMTLRTPKLGDEILDGVTRASVMELAKRRGLAVEEKDYLFRDVVHDVTKGHVKEVFACGTAGGLVGIGSFYYYPESSGEDVAGAELSVGDGKMGQLTRELRLELLAIQNGEGEDLLGWRHEIRGEDLPAQFL